MSMRSGVLIGVVATLLRGAPGCGSKKTSSGPAVSGKMLTIYSSPRFRARRVRSPEACTNVVRVVG
jgi:hypothetical protein